jgi:sugar phosphate permease
MFALGLISAVWLGTSLFYLYLFYTTLGVVSGAASPLPYGVVVSRWFDRHRGLALGLMMVGLGLGGITLPLAAQRLIVLFNWRVAYASFGCAALLLSLPVITVFLNDDPADKGLLPDGDSPQHVKNSKDRIEGMSSREIMHQRTFWLLIGIFFLVGGSVHACVLHMAPLLTDRGVNEEAAAAATSLVGLALLVGRIGAGYLLDRFFAPRLAMLLFGGAAAGIALLWVGSTGTLAILAAFFIGLGMGAEADVIAYTISRYFGLRAFGLAYGYGFAAYMLAGALGGFLMGVGFDLTHSYTAPLGVLFLAMATGIGLLTRLGPYRYVPRPVGVPEAGSLAREA